MALTNYHKKRDFRKTPEPKGEKAKRRKKLAFVVQEHQASQLHYDFRLELDGVLKSWAVPKGPSMNPHDKHLAMMVEDHPLEYRKFEGTIPEGNYGAGEVIIWDKGTYTAHHPDDDELKALRHGLKKGHLVIELDGEKLKGEFALIKMENAKEENAWLLVKKDDEYASEKDITKQTESVVSGKNLNVPTQDYKEYPKQKVDEPIKPMLATLTDEPFTAEDWLFEIKWDGYRAIASKHSHTVKLYSRNDQDFRQTYPSILEALQDIKHDFILDGEIVAIDEAGTPHFEWLQNWHRTPEGNLYYYIFDIVAFHGHDLHTMPLIERKALLQHIIPEDSPIRFSDHIKKDGEKLFREIKKQHIEGIMAKKATSHYKQNTRGKDWLKIKTHTRQEVVIGGFTEPRGSRQHLGALIVGVYTDEGDLIYTGHSGGGIPDTARKELRQKLEKRERKTSPFKTKPKPNAPVHWVTPELVCEMEFSEWTKDGYMRHPKFIGMREDKKATDVRKEISET